MTLSSNVHPLLPHTSYVGDIQFIKDLMKTGPKAKKLLGETEKKKHMNLVVSMSVFINSAALISP